MTSPPERSLGRHLEPALDAARLERQVAAIAAQAGPARGRTARRLVTFASVGVVGLAIIVGVVASRRGARAVADATSAPGTTFEALAGGEKITLADGSRVVLEARSKLTLLAVRPELVRVALDRGGVDLDVVHQPGRQFVVEARGYEIRVLGTRFRVRLGETAGAAALEVQVTRGRVRVTRGGPSDDQDVRVLGAGETWSTTPAAASASVPEGEDAPAAHPKPSSAAGSGDGPRALLARAEAHRAANEPRAAARLFDALRVRHRSDARAGLAAFELGRLRLDRLDDPRGAAEAFEDAIAVAPDASFREDAQARLVEAYDEARDHRRCLAAREVYLSRYPRGLHRATVAARCPE